MMNDFTPSVSYLDGVFHDQRNRCSNRVTVRNRVVAEILTIAFHWFCKKCFSPLILRKDIASTRKGKRRQQTQATQCMTKLQHRFALVRDRDSTPLASQIWKTLFLQKNPDVARQTCLRAQSMEQRTWSSVRWNRKPQEIVNHRKSGAIQTVKTSLGRDNILMQHWCCCKHFTIIDCNCPFTPCKICCNDQVLTRHALLKI